MRLFVFISLLFLSACAVQRAEVAREAQDKMIGLSKERLLACMGVPAGKMTEGGTEVWSYNSGDGKQVSVATANTAGQFSAQRNGNSITGQSTSSTIGSRITTSRFCTINITFQEGAVSSVQYQGPTGGILTRGEQCAYAVENCTSGRQ